MSDALNYEHVEAKLLLLYLIDKMDLPLSHSQITDYVSQAEYLDHFQMSQTLAEMVEGGYLDYTKDNNVTRYALTEEGQTTLEYFEKHIPVPVRTKINNFVRDHRKDIKREYENTATFFPDERNDQFTVKCGVYEDERVLMELFISVDTREHARLIQTNWKANAKVLYGRIMEALATSPEN